MRKQNKVMVGALALLVMGTSSLAYFTDRTESNFNAKAGNLCLTHVNSDSDLLNMAPGDLRDISFEYKNEGTLAMDTRITYMLSYEMEDSKAGITEGKVVTLLDGDDELVTKEVGDGVAKVTVNDVTIQGTTDKVGEASLKKNLKLKLHESVVNDFQDATFHIDVVIEGKQNKNDAQWEEINTEKITVRADELNVVRQSACNIGDDLAEKVTYSYSTDDNVKKAMGDFVADYGETDEIVVVEFVMKDTYESHYMVKDNKLWNNGQSYEVDKLKDIDAEDVYSLNAFLRKGHWIDLDEDGSNDSFIVTSVRIKDKDEIEKALEDGYHFNFTDYSIATPEVDE